MVAAWMRADTGVGPSIASGSQMCRGIMADLPMPPMNMSTKAQVSAEPPMNTGAALLANTPLTVSAVPNDTWYTSLTPSTGIDVSSVKLNVPV